MLSTCSYGGLNQYGHPHLPDTRYKSLHYVAYIEVNEESV